MAYNKFGKNSIKISLEFDQLLIDFRLHFINIKFKL